MSGMVFRPRGKRKQVGINMTPLIDVLFLLIIFFMLTGTFKRAGEMELRLPDSTTSTPYAEGEENSEVELIVTEDGQLLLNGQEVERAQLKQRLVEIMREDPQSRIRINAEAAVTHGEVVVLLDIVRRAGFPGVGIGTWMKAEAEKDAIR